MRPGEILQETKTLCGSWALLRDRFHLLLRIGPVPISTVMKHLLTGYALWFNRRHRRHGPLFLAHIVHFASAANHPFRLAEGLQPKRSNPLFPLHNANDVRDFATPPVMVMLGHVDFIIAHPRAGLPAHVHIEGRFRAPFHVHGVLDGDGESK
jgi:hypothetical protein